MKEKEIRALLNEAKGKSANQFSPEIENAIVEAAKIGGELKAEAALVVHRGLERFEGEVLYREYGISSHHQDFGDCMNEIYLQILKGLKHWDPSISKLTTYFPYWIGKGIKLAKIKNQARQQPSMYYRELDCKINVLEEEAKRELSREEIKEGFKKKGLEISDWTLDMVLKHRVNVVSLDSVEEMTAHEDEPGYSERVLETIRNMDQKYAPIIKIVCDYYLENSNSLTEKKFLSELRKYKPGVSEKWAIAMRRNAFAEYQATFRRLYPENADVESVCYFG